MRERRLPPLLRRAWYSLNQEFRQRIAPLGITPDQYSILRWLREGPATGLTQSELTHRMASDPNTIAATVRRMESSGLLLRSAHQRDRRARQVTLRPEGARLFELAHAIAAELQRAVLSELEPEESERFLELLEKIAEACAKQASDPSKDPSKEPS
jgi:DNA-binding MarR family transcriptional regulator